VPRASYMSSYESETKNSPDRGVRCEVRGAKIIYRTLLNPHSNQEAMSFGHSEFLVPVSSLIINRVSCSIQDASSEVRACDSASVPI
jgi:hypothetical protein